MRIHKPEIVRKGLETAYQVSVDSIVGERTLWFRVPREHEELLTRSCNPALVGLLLPAMAAGEDIIVDGPVSEKLWFNLSGPLQHLLQHNAPYLQHIKIIADSADNQVGNPGGVATGLSGGVDSFFTLKTYAGEEVTPGFRLTHLFVNNVGSPDGGIMFRERFERLKPVAEKYNLPFLSIDSNLDDFYSDVRFRDSFSLRNVASAQILENGVSRYLCSSGQHYFDVTVGTNQEIAHIDPMTLPLLSTERQEAITAGSEYTRVQKTLRVAELTESHSLLEVCIDANSTENCGKCTKCVRTFLTLDIAGMVDRYRSVVDLQHFSRNRNLHLIRLLSSPKALEKEVVVFAKQNGYRIPLWVSLASRLMRRDNRLTRLAMRMARKVMSAIDTTHPKFVKSHR